MTRRDVLALPVAAAASRTLRPAARRRFSIPGLFPGRVVSVTHSGASKEFEYQTGAIQDMVRRGMMELTGMPNPVAAWRRLFHPGDVVGIKVNPVPAAAMTTSPACLLEVINGLLLAGVRPNDIVVYERYQYLLGFVKSWLSSLAPWVRTSFATPGYYTDDQTSLTGYDPNYYVDLPQYLKPWEKPDVPAHTRSYVARFVTREVTKIISLAQLKDHQAAGVTLNLKNITAGCVNNWNRFHDEGINDDSKDYLVYAIPAVASLPVLRDRVVLGIIDGVHCLTNGGPINYADPKYGFVAEHNTIYFATDIVAADRVGWLAVNAERAKKGLPPEESAGPDGYDVFSKRQPQHIIVAGQAGLGEWRDDHIDYRNIALA